MRELLLRDASRALAGGDLQRKTTAGSVCRKDPRNLPGPFQSTTLKGRPELIISMNVSIASESAVLSWLAQDGHSDARNGKHWLTPMACDAAHQGGDRWQRLLTDEDVVRRIAAECVHIDERGGVGIRLVLALVRRPADGTPRREAKIEDGCLTRRAPR